MEARHVPISRPAGAREEHRGTLPRVRPNATRGAGFYRNAALRALVARRPWRAIPSAGGETPAAAYGPHCARPRSRHGYGIDRRVSLEAPFVRGGKTWDRRICLFCADLRCPCAYGT